MPSQRPFFLSSFFASFRQQTPALQATTQQASKHTTQSASTSSPSAAVAAAAAAASSSSNTSRSISTNTPTTANVAIHSPRGSPGSPIPIPHGSRRRGSDSSSEGFRDAIGADKWYIGGRTAGGEEKFFKLGVIRRVRSNDGLSLDRLSL